MEQSRPDKILKITYLLLFCFWMSACSSTPEIVPEPKTTLSLFIEAGADINSSPTNKAAPLQVRMYELTDKTLFEQADFLALYLEDTVALQDSLIKKYPLPTIQPGSQQTLNFELDKATRYIAILGEFARYQTAISSVIQAIAVNNDNQMALQIDDNYLRLGNALNDSQQAPENPPKSNSKKAADGS